MKNTAKIKIQFFIVLIFSFIFLLAQALNVTLNPKSSKAFSLFGMVLGDDDGEDKNEEENEQEDEEEDSEDSKNSEDKEDDEDESSKDSSEDEDKEDDVDEEDDSDQDRVREVERTVVRSNGGTTKIKKNIENNKEEYEIKVYNAAGKVVEERKYKSEDDGAAKLEIKNFDETGDGISELKYTTKDGEEVKLKIETQDGTKTRLRYDSENNRVVLVRKVDDEASETEIDSDSLETETEAESEDEISIEVEEEDGTFKIKQKQFEANVRFPMVINSDGDVVVVTPNKEIVLGTMPEVIVQKAMDEQEVDDVSNVEIVEDEATKNLRYQLTAEKKEKVLGLFETNIPLLLKYDANTGEFESSSQDFISSLLDLLSF